VLVSSAKVSGETSGAAPLTADDVRPPDEYARSKWESEEALRRALPAERFTIVRPPLVYGPGVRANFRSLIEAVDRRLPLPLGAVRNARSLVFVRNLADALVWLAMNPNAAGWTGFVSDDDDVATPELVRRIAHSLRTRALLVPVPVALLRIAAAMVGKRAALEKAIGSFRVDAAPLRALGWRPPFSMEQGLTETARWFAQRKERS
jgi:nucleoside-diphosphate-sugar epimerase